MEILIFYQYFGTPQGSWSTRIYELSRRWVQDGHRVVVVTSPFEKSDIRTNAFIEKRLIDGIELVIINCGDSNRYGSFKRISRAILFSILSIYYALRTKADVVVASSGPITVGLPGLLAKWFRNRKFVFEVRDLWPQGAVELGKLNNRFLRAVAEKFEKICYKNADLVAACSVGMESSVLKTVPGSRTIVIPNGSDLELFNVSVNPDKLPDCLKGKSIFLYAGSLGLMDDCSQIIRAMRLVTGEPIALAILGDGPEKERLEIEAAKTLNPNIFFGGIIPKKEVVKWFSIASASFVTFKDIPVLHTSSPNKMFDSFAAGLPIIQSTKGWIKDLVVAESCGINVRPDVPEDFAEAMRALSSDPQLRERMAKNCLRLASSTFNRDKLAMRYLEAITAL